MIFLIWIKKQGKVWKVKLFPDVDRCLAFVDLQYRNNTGLPYLVIKDFRSVVNYKYFAYIYRNPKIEKYIEDTLNAI